MAPLEYEKLQFQEAGQHVCQERKTCGFDVKPVQEKLSFQEKLSWTQMCPGHTLQLTL